MAGRAEVGARRRALGRAGAPPRSGECLPATTATCPPRVRASNDPAAAPLTRGRPRPLVSPRLELRVVGPRPPLSVAASTDAVVLVGNEHERDSTTSIRRDQDPCARNRLSQAKCRRTRTSMLGSRRTKIKEAALPRSARPRDESSGRLRGRGPAPRLDQTSGFSSRRGSDGRPRSSNLLLPSMQLCSALLRADDPLCGLLAFGCAME
jgi:hypothetical protein